MLAWVTYCVLVSALLGVAAVAAERSLRWLGGGTRWAWGVALGGGIGLPLWAWLVPASAESAGSFGPLAGGSVGAYVMESLTPLTLAPPSAGSGPALSELALACWAVVTALLAVRLTVSALGVWFHGRAWRRTELEGVEVLVSRETGPAAMGLWRGRVVVPEWVLDLDGARRRLLVMHEDEHVRARDPQLALAGLVVCVLMPWNPVLWWQLARLRLAIEMDCDARVLRRARDVRGYGSLLLEVGQRRARLAVGLAETKSSLERRIRMITNGERSRGVVGGLALAAAAGFLLVLACETPSPTEVAGPAPEETVRGIVEVRAAGLGCEPRIYIDGEATGRGLEAVKADLVPDDIERIEVIKIPQPDDPEFCGAILILTKDASPEAAERMRRVAEELGVRQRPTREELEAEPTFTPMTVRPQLRNNREVQQALVDHYPMLLRDAGIGGVANVWFFIDETGEVRQTRLNTTSGYEALDAAALEIAGKMRFSPAKNRDVEVPVWVALDIRFETSAGQVSRSTRPPPDRAAQLERRARVEAEMRPKDSEIRRRSSAELAQEPTFTPMTERPQLRNDAAVRDAIREHYPPLLRNAGIEGVAIVWLFIDEAGVVRDARINRTSGYDALDEAALRVARQMRFSPAKNRDVEVPVWLALDVRFEAE